jgi:hypothetical protein
VEADMHEHSARKGANWKPLLLIPVALVIAKGISNHRARWDATAGGPGRHRHSRRGFGRREWMADDGGFRLPPKIEAMLDAWHTRAHEQSDHDEAPESTTV